MKKAARSKALAHALAEMPKEACGLVVIVKGRERYIPCKNLAPNATDMFILDPEDYAAAEELGEITEVFHSHPVTVAAPSEADRIACESSGLPWVICNPVNDTWAELTPCGFKAPLIGREYTWAVADCWSLIRDWYIENNILLPDWPRPADPKEFENNPIFDECWATAGFSLIDEEEELKRGDALLMRINSKGLDHCAVYIGDSMILHHLAGRLSSRDIYGGGGWYETITGKRLRHYDWARLQVG
jgi:proteasome lid subunit RPN8/RPN11